MCKSGFFSRSVFFIQGDIIVLTELARLGRNNKGVTVDISNLSTIFMKRWNN